MAGSVLRAAVVGGATLLGRELLNEIGNSSAAAWDLRLLEEGEEHEGQLTSAGDEALVVHSLNQDSFSGLDVVFFAAAPEITARFMEPAMQAGVAVIDLSGSTAEKPGFVLRSPWVVASPRPDLTTIGVCVPHPAALMLAIVSERLQRRFGAVDLVATILEPASQAGSPGVDELHQQTVSLLSFQDLPKTIFDAQVAFNLQTTLGPEARVDLRATLTRIRRDVRGLLGAAVGVLPHVQLLQAPVFHGYVLSVYFHTAEPWTPEALRKALEGPPVLFPEDAVPSNKSAVESGDLLISTEVDDGAAADGELSGWLLLAADNLGLMARSAVGAAVELTALRPAARVQ